MADFDFDEKDPLKENIDDKDDNDGGNIASGGASSIPAPRQTRMNIPSEQTSFVELPELPGLSTTRLAEEELRKEFPKADLSKLQYRMKGKVGNERLMVGVFGNEKIYPLVTKIQGKEEYRISPKLPDEVKRALGKKGRRDTLEQQIKMLTDGIIDNKAVAKDTSVSQTERDKARDRAKTQEINELLWQEN